MYRKNIRFNPGLYNDAEFKSLTQPPVKKNVLHVLNISFGLRYFIGDQFDFFQKQGIDFHVACQPDDFLYKYSEQKKFAPHAVNIVRAINPVKDFIAIVQVIKIIKKNKIDIVIGHTPKGGLVAMVAAVLSRTQNRIYVRHGLMYETSKGVKRAILKTIEKITGHLASKVVCVSMSILNITNKEKLSPYKNNIIFGKGTPNGIDCYGKFNPENIYSHQVVELKQKFQINTGTKVIGYVGRLVKDKGIVELYNAWQLLKKETGNLKLMLVGPFEERDSISQDVKDAILSDPTIICVGMVEKDVELYYSLMNIFILPDRKSVV